ncbi:MAG: ABC transporter ATP-binding protein [Gammaproteobacteria bacterium]
MSIIKVESLSKTFGQVNLFGGVDLSWPSGSSVAIVGISGSGKTTLLSILAGLELPSTGRVFFDQICITSLSEEERARVRRENTAFVFQHFGLIPHLNVLENALVLLELKKTPNAYPKAKAMLDRLGLSARLKHYPNTLSGGERQRVALARAFVAAPRILFADEPTGSLDENNAKLIIDLILQLNAENRSTLVCVTHDPKLKIACQKALRLEHGKLQE